MDPGNSVRGGLLGLTLGGADQAPLLLLSLGSGALAPGPMKHEELTLRPSCVPGSTWVSACFLLPQQLGRKSVVDPLSRQEK